MGFTLHEFMSKNFPYRYFGILDVCTYSGHVCACPKYVYTYFKRACAYVCMHKHALGFSYTFSFPKIISQVKFHKIGPKSTLGLQVMSSLGNGGLGHKGYQMRCL